MTTIHPVVGVTACRKEIAPHSYHVVQDKYVEAVRDAAGGVPLVVPSEGHGTRPESIVDAIDGLLLTGAYSNVEPRRYGASDGSKEVLRDPDRDETTARLIEAALRVGCPILGICRGLQELNVAFGGTLHEALHEREGGLDHREPGETLEANYGPAHPVELAPDSELARIVQADTLMVNSLHAQGIDRLADGLVAEAWAPDGVVEAIRLAESTVFAIAVQWHPEYRAVETSSSKALFSAFGMALSLIHI